MLHLDNVTEFSVQNIGCLSRLLMNKECESLVETGVAYDGKPSAIARGAT